MNLRTEKIYYADEQVLEQIEKSFQLVDSKDFYELYQNKNDGTFWRLDAWEKYQERILTKLPSNSNWTEFNDRIQRIELLKNERGVSSEKCIWKDCTNNSLNDLVYCELHAFEEMGIRR